MDGLICFDILPLDIMLEIVSYLTRNDRYLLWQVDRYLNQFGKCFKLRAYDDIIREIERIAPHMEYYDTPQKQLAAIKAGQETVYTIEFSNEESLETMRIRNLVLGYHSRVDRYASYFINLEAINAFVPIVTCRGGPIAKDTEMYIFGYIKYTFDDLRDGERIIDSFRFALYDDIGVQTIRSTAPNYPLSHANNFENYTDVYGRIIELVAWDDNSIRDNSDQGICDYSLMFFDELVKEQCKKYYITDGYGGMCFDDIFFFQKVIMP